MPATSPLPRDLSHNYSAVRQDWLDRRPEAILEPELPIIDPHHHLWDRPGWRYLHSMRAGFCRSLRAHLLGESAQQNEKSAPAVMANIANEVDVFSPQGALIHRYSGAGNNALDFNASAVFKGGSCS